MERKEFLRSLGAGAAFALVFPCLGGCSNDNGSEGEMEAIPENIDFTIDLNSSEAANLANNGGFIRKNLVVIARNLEGDFVAVTQVCSHEQNPEVEFIPQNGGFFYCEVHGSIFSQDGSPMNGVTSRSLKIYRTSLDGSILRVFE